MARILSIVAPCNNSGKTSLAATILSRWPGRFTALKVSTVYGDGANCPRSETACACRELKGRFTILEGPGLVEQPGTDTGLLASSGARRTLWCLVRPGAHADLWTRLSEQDLAAGGPILTEGNKIVEVAGPDRLVVVVDPASPRSRWKDDAWELMARADLVVLNRRPGSEPGGPEEDLAGEISGRSGAHLIREDVRRPLGDWSDPALLDLGTALLAGAGAGPGPVPPAGQGGARPLS